jgi:outer membrane protein
MIVCGSVALGCAAINPDKFAPRSAYAPWVPTGEEDEPLQPTEVSLLPPARCMEVITGPPKTLAQLSNVALRNSPLARGAWASARRAAAEHGRVLSQYYPELSINAIGGYSHFLFQMTGHPLDIDQLEFQPLVQLNWLLLDFGRRSGEARETFEKVLAANLMFNRELQDIVYAVQTDYYQLQAAQEMVKASETSLQQAVTVRTSAERKLDTGLATRPEFLLAKRVEAKAIYDLENSKVLVTDAEAQLALTLGVSATCPVVVDTAGNITLPAELEEGVDALVDLAISTRPDLGAYLAKVRAQDAAVETARAQFMPEISFIGQFGGDFWDYTIGVTSERVKTIEPNYEVFLTFEWDLFVGFERENAVRSAVASREIASAELEQAGLGAISEVWKSYYRVRAARKRFRYAESLLAASSDAYAATYESYQRGLSTIVELLDADRDLASGRYILVQSRAKLLIETATLAYAAGTIFRAAQVPPPDALAKQPMAPQPPTVVEDAPAGGPAAPEPPPLGTESLDRDTDTDPAPQLREPLPEPPKPAPL